MLNITMYSAQGCGFCSSAERLLSSLGVHQITKIRVDLEAEKLAEMIAKTNQKTVPQIFIGDLHIGGFDALSILHRSGKLKQLLFI
jgi:glutaredoxin 3